MGTLLTVPEITTTTKETMERHIDTIDTMIDITKLPFVVKGIFVVQLRRFFN